MQRDIKKRLDKLEQAAAGSGSKPFASAYTGDGGQTYSATGWGSPGSLDADGHALKPIDLAELEKTNRVIVFRYVQDWRQVSSGG